MPTTPSQPLLATSPAKTPRHQLSLLLFLLACYFLLRLPNLTAIPVFCDEAAYLRWAQLIRADPFHNAWVSMHDYKLPLHYWLLALFHLPNADPVYAGRLFSVLTGAALIPLLFALGTELQHLLRFRNAPHYLPAAQFFPPLAAAFMITSPLFAFYQTMALAEPLLILESVALLLLSLRLARQLASAPATTLATAPATTPQAHDCHVVGAMDSPTSPNNQNCGNPKPKTPLPTATLLGLTWAATLLTKQNFSYLLWFFPPFALALYTTRQNARILLKKSLLPLALATALGLLFFIPAVFTTSLSDLKLNLIYKSTFFRVPGESRLQVFFENLTVMVSPRATQLPYWWPHNPLRPLEDGALYVDFTPPIFFFLILGTLALVRRRHWLPLIFFGTWIALLFGSIVAHFSWIRSRYALLGIFPILLFIAWITADLLSHLAPKTQAHGCDAVGRLAASTIKIQIPKFRLAPALTLALLLAWPFAATIAQLTSIDAPTRTRDDRMEYISRFSSGQATQSAIAWLQQQAALHPITVITNTGFGTENDLVWLRLANNKNVQLLAAASLPYQFPPLNPDGTRTFCTEQWFPDRTTNLRLDPDRPTYTVQGLGLNSEEKFVCNPQPRDLTPRAQLVQMFINVPTTPKEKPLYVNAIILLNPNPPSAPQIANVRPTP